MSTITLHFWSWDRPLLQHAIAELTEGWSAGALDLSDTLMVCPTGETVRRLRQALAEAAAARHSAVMAPHVWHPEMALLWQPVATAVATSMQERLAWARVLRDMKLDAVSELFPVPPAAQDTGWALATAQTLATLRRSVGAAGLSFADVADKLADAFDAARWRDLAMLERAFLDALASSRAEDVQSLKRRHAANPAVPEGVKRVCVFGMADPPPLFREWLRHLSGQVPVQNFVFADAAERARFDAMGFPRVEAWGDAAGLCLDFPAANIHLVSTPQEQAARTVALLDEALAAGHAVALGTCDPALNTHLESALAAGDVRAFDPAGRLARTHALVETLRLFLKAVQSDAWSAWRVFFGQHDALVALAGTDARRQQELLVALDELSEEHLPATLDDALSFVPAEGVLREALSQASTQARRWSGDYSAAHVRALLGWLYGACEFHTEADADRDAVMLLGEMASLADELAATLPPGLEKKAATWLGLLLEEMAATQLTDTRGEMDLVLQGWLELLWEPASALILAGCNDEHLPGTLAIEPFLPDHMRQRLGLPCQASRRARDAFLLRAIFEQRRRNGCLHLVLGRVNDEGDALKPSRLLFDVPDAELTARVKLLFPKDDEAGKKERPQPAPSIAWKLRPVKRAAKLDSISCSRLSSYLACPFRFYLKHVLGMKDSAGVPPRELNLMQFGNLLHAVLCDFGNDPSIKDSHDEAEMGAWLDANLTRRCEREYGRQPLFSVVLQIESARQRLQAFVAQQAALRKDGWIIKGTEVLTEAWGFQLEGIALHGKIDRLDHHEGRNEWRVWDYKTGSAPKPPAKAHLTRAKDTDTNDEQRAWMCFTPADGRTQCWTDLQLPLYALAVEHHKAVTKAGASVGYFNLPSAVGDTEAVVWEELDAALREDARRCAETAIRRIREGIFWPPAESGRFDDFAHLILGDAAQTVCEPQDWKEAAA